MDTAHFAFGMAVGLVTSIVVAIAKWQWPLIKSVFDAEGRRVAEQISGEWNATEIFSGSASTDTFTMRIICRSGRVTGMHTCLSGPDVGKSFDITGTYKDQVLSFTWAPSSRAALESGTVTAKLSQDKLLEGHGLYIEPADGKVYTSTFTATKA